MKFSTLLLSCICISGYSQDYLVTNGGDTLRGEVKPRYADRLDEVQISANKKKTTFTARQIMVYSFRGDLYRPLQRENTIRFMKVLKSGFLSLYAFRVDNMSTYDGRLLAKRDGTSMEVPNLTFKKLLTNYLGDCQSLKEKINKGDYGRKDLNAIIDLYNNCLEAKPQIAKVDPPVTPEATKQIDQLENFKKTIEGLDSLASKQDAVDLINDLLVKVKAGKSIPNYQIQALKGFFKDNDRVKEELEKVLSGLVGN